MSKRVQETGVCVQTTFGHTWTHMDTDGHKTANKITARKS